MNGELLELYTKVKGDFDKFQAMIVERWNNHDKRSDNFASEFKSLQMVVTKLPCSAQGTDIKWLVKSNYILWGVLIISGIVKLGIMLIGG